jgi:DNA-binding NarL/FixJ family response regulator
VSARTRTVLIAAGDRLFAEAASAYLGRQEGWNVVGTARDGLGALAAVTRLQPSCALLIGDMPRLGTAALCARIRQRSPDTTVVVLGLADVPGAQVLPAGVVAAAVLAALGEGPGSITQASPEVGRSDIDKLRSLTPRERTTLKLLAGGLSMGEIAARLNVSTHTVRTHMQNLYAKLGVHSRLELVHFASRHGLLGGGE